MEYKLPKSELSTKPIVSQSLFEVRSIAEDNIRSLKVYVVKTRA